MKTLLLALLTAILANPNEPILCNGEWQVSTKSEENIQVHMAQTSCFDSKSNTMLNVEVACHSQMKPKVFIRGMNHNRQLVNYIYMFNNQIMTPKWYHINDYDMALVSRKKNNDFLNMMKTKSIIFMGWLFDTKYILTSFSVKGAKAAIEDIEQSCHGN